MKIIGLKIQDVYFCDTLNLDDNMNLHEYQGKDILSSFGVKIQRGIVAQNANEAVAAAKQLTNETGTSWYVIKAQVHAGGRGKGGGVKLAKSLEEVETIAGQIIGMDLVTPQTSAQGKRVHQVWWPRTFIIRERVNPANTICLFC